MPGRRPDLVVIPRSIPAGSGWATFIRSLHDAGIVLVGDYDDDVLQKGPLADDMAEALLAEGKDPAVFERNMNAMFESTVAGLRRWAGATVATLSLAERLRPYLRPCAPIVVVPNAIRPEAYVEARLRGKRELQPLVIGRAGTTRGRSDFETTGMVEAWERIARRYPDVTFLTIGGRPLFLEERLAPERVVAWPTHKLEAYPYALINI